MSTPPKKRRLRASDSVKKEIQIDLTEEDPEPSVHATECTICCEKCMTSGDHRLASLACGHLFGQSCIEKWVKQSKTCPVCNQTVKRNDVRVLFTDCIAVVDNSRQEEFNQKYLTERAQRTAIEVEVAKLRLQNAALQFECEKHKERIMDLLEENSYLKSNSTSLSTQNTVASASWSYSNLSSIPCSDARVCAVSNACDLLCVGTKMSSTSELQHGLLLVSLTNVSHRAFIPLHRSAVRDISISADCKLVATTAMDGRLHITNPSTQRSILHFDMPGLYGWSCTWDAANPHGIRVGHHNGQVSLYDIRRPGSAAAESLMHEFKQPVHAVSSMMVSDLPIVVAATFSGLSSWSGAGDGQPLVHRMHMPVKHCCSMSRNQMNPKQIVVSTRTAADGSGGTLPAQHYILSLTATTNSVETSSEGVMEGHTTPSAISRSAIWTSSDEKSTIVASGDITAHTLNLWDTESTKIVQQYKAPHPVIDVQHAIQDSSWSYHKGILAILSNNQVNIYKSNQSL